MEKMATSHYKIHESLTHDMNDITDLIDNIPPDSTHEFDAVMGIFLNG